MTGRRIMDGLAGADAAAQGSAPLLLLPGLLCDRAVWAEVQPHLPAGIAVMVPSYAAESDLGAMAERVLAAAPPTFALAGFSLGGRVALEVVRRAPQRVRRLALLDTGFAPLPPGAAGEEERRRRLALVALAHAEGMRALGAAWLPPLLHPARRADARLAGTILAMVARHTPAGFAAHVAALLARPDAAAVLATIAVPTLVLCGREDGWSPLAQHEALAARIPGSRLVAIPECGHFAPLEQPRAVGAALSAWLRAEGRPPVLAPAAGGDHGVPITN